MTDWVAKKKIFGQRVLLGIAMENVLRRLRPLRVNPFKNWEDQGPRTRAAVLNQFLSYRRVKLYLLPNVTLRGMKLLKRTKVVRLSWFRP